MTDNISILENDYKDFVVSDDTQLYKGFIGDIPIDYSVDSTTNEIIFCTDGIKVLADKDILTLINVEINPLSPSMSSTSFFTKLTRNIPVSSLEFYLAFSGVEYEVLVEARDILKKTNITKLLYWHLVLYIYIMETGKFPSISEDNNLIWSDSDNIPTEPELGIVTDDLILDDNWDSISKDTFFDYECEFISEKEAPKSRYCIRRLKSLEKYTTRLETASQKAKSSIRGKFLLMPRVILAKTGLFLS